MKLIDQSHEILHITPYPLRHIEIAGRTCYKSEDKMTEDSAQKFVKMLKDRGHEAMLEFGYLMVRLITNRGVTHEMVRHRLCSFAQESTRYVNYYGEMEFINPVWIPEVITDVTMASAYTNFKASCSNAEKSYRYLLDAGWRPEQAREVLPNALKTEIVVGANLREWMHIFKLRANPKAHPQMVALMKPLQEEVRALVPVLFD